MSLTLPPVPESPTAIRVRRMRVARGACWVIAAAVLAVGGLAALDAAATLPAWVRGVGLAAWVTGIGVLAWRLVLTRWRAVRTLHPNRAAARELPGNIRASAAAAIALLGSFTAALCLPNAAVHVRRVALPWYRPAGGQYRVVVTSGDPVVGRGDAVTLSAYLEPIDPGAPRPGSVVVVCRQADGAERQMDLAEDDAGVFHATYPGATNDFRYKVEAGGAASDWYDVTVIALAEPTARSSIHVIAPAYAATAFPSLKLEGFVPFTGCQYGKAELSLQFSRPAVGVVLQWRPEAVAMAEPITFTLTSDGLSGTATLPLRQDGQLRLTTVAERNGKSLSSAHTIAVRVAAHGPPRLVRASGASLLPLKLRPGQPLHIELAAEDDVAVGEAVLEYAIGNGPAQLVAIPLKRPLPTQALGEIDWDIGRKLRAEEAVRYRIRIANTRKLADPELKPQEATFPETGWASLQLDATAPPLVEQEIENQRIALHQELVRAAAAIQEISSTVGSLRDETAKQFELHHEVFCKQARERCERTRSSLAAAVRTASLAPDLRSFANAFRSVADRHLREACEQLDRAVTNDPAVRKTSLEGAARQFDIAARLIEQLQVRNEVLARARLDVFRLTNVLAEERSLLMRMKAGGAVAEDLAGEQKDVWERLMAAVRASDLLHAAVVAASQRGVQNAAIDLSEVAGAVQMLDAAVKELEAELRQKALAGISADAAAATERTTARLAKLEAPSRISAVPLPKPEDFRRASGLVTAGKTFEALAELQKNADLLSGLATSFEKTAAERISGKLAARQYAIWLEDLSSRIASTSRGNVGAFPIPAATQTAFLDELAAISASASALNLPPVAELAAAREGVVKQLDEVRKLLAGTGVGAMEAMAAARAALNRLADKTPSLSDRLTKARGEFEGVRLEQEAISKALQKLPRVDVADAGSLAAFARIASLSLPAQRKVLAGFEALDLPGLDHRRARCIAAISASIADFKQPLPHDIVASQEWVRREFEEMRQLLRNVEFQAGDIEAESGLQKVQRLGSNRYLGAKKAQEERLKPVNRQASDAARRLLQAEAEELAFTRVGPAGQFHKQRARELYDALIARTEPDRDYGKQAELAEKLSELAALMADLEEYALPVAIDTVMRGPAAADVYLASRPHADDLQALARDYLQLRDRLNHVPDELRRRTASKDGNPFAAILVKQRELAGEVATLADRGKIDASATEKARQALASARTAADKLAVGRKQAARDGARTAAAILRMMAEGEKNSPAAAIASRQDALVLEMENLPDDPAAASTQQVARGQELAARAAELAVRLESLAGDRDPADGLRTTLTDAAAAATAVAKLLTEASRPAAGAKVDAEKSRKEARTLLADHASRIARAAPAAPPGTDPALARAGDAIDLAERLMRRAEQSLRTKSDRAEAEDAIETAITSLTDATSQRRLEKRGLDDHDR